MKKIKFFSIIIFFLFFANSIFAAGGSKMLLENYGGIPSVVVSSLTSSDPELAIASYIDMLIKIAFGFASIGAVILIVWGGIIYTSPTYTKKQAGKEKIIHALIAILILVGSFMLFQEVNPDALQVRFHLAKPIANVTTKIEIQRKNGKEIKYSDKITGSTANIFENIIDYNITEKESAEDLPEGATSGSSSVEYEMIDDENVHLDSAGSVIPVTEPWHVITQGFGMTAWARAGHYGGRPHNAVDLRCRTGTEIVAAADGKIKRIGRTTTNEPHLNWAGNFVEIQHKNGNWTRYCHLASIRDKIEIEKDGKKKKVKFEKGVEIKAGQKIGVCGGTGGNWPIHLHFQLFNAENQALNPHHLVPSLKDIPCASNIVHCHETAK